MFLQKESGMADDSQRNFRSVYYEKVGFRGVEEKKSLEILLKDDRLGKLISLFALFLFLLGAGEGVIGNVYLLCLILI